MLVVFIATCTWAPAIVVGAQEQHPGEYAAADIERGARTYASQCLTCHSATGDGVAGIDLRRNLFRRVASDDDLRKVIVEGVPGTGMPKANLNQGEQNGLVAFIRAGMDVRSRAAKVGDPTRGKALYETKGNCASCHRVRGAGVRKGPDLTDIGALRTASMLQQTLVDPTAYLLPINRPIQAVTRDGKTITGRRLNEDTYSVQVVDEAGNLVSLEKSNLTKYQVLTSSAMPAYRDTLSPDEISDLVAYLLSLRFP